MDSRPSIIPKFGNFADHPLFVIWELTQACDLECVHCRACAKSERDPNELTTLEGKRLLDDIAKMGTPLVILTGGDPAKRDDLCALIQHGTDIGLAMALTPSGTPLMTNDVLARIRDAGTKRLAVSIDGPDAATHDAFRRVEGSFAHSLRILARAKELGIPLQVNTTVGPHNHKALRAMADLVADIGVALWSVFVVVPTGRAGKDLLMTPKRLEAILEELADIAATATHDVKTTAAPHFRRIQMERTHHTPTGVLRDLDEDGNVRGPRGINDGIGMMFVSHTGEIFPSGFLPIHAGLVREESLGDVYRHSPVFQRLRDVEQLTGKCGVCPFKLVCGGARSRAFAMSGDFMASDDLCAYIPKRWNESLHSTS